jgi:hypothetical protein
MNLDMSSAIQLATMYTQYVSREPIQSTETINSTQVLWIGNSFQSTNDITQESVPSSVTKKSLKRILYNMTASTRISRQLSVPNAFVSDVSSTSRRRLSVFASKYEDKDEVDGSNPNILWLSHETMRSDDAVLMNMMQRLQSIQQERTV